MTEPGLFRGLVSLGGSGRRWPVAVQAALAISVPIVVFTLAGAPTFGLQACLGAFTVLYVAGSSLSVRARVLPIVAVALVLSATAGSLLSVSVLLSVVGLVVITAVASILAFGFRLGPPGPLFFPLVYGASAHITAPVDDVRAVDPLLFVALVASGCAFAYVVAIAPGLPRRTGVGGADPARDPLTRPQFDAAARIVTARCLTATLLAGVVSVSVEPARGYWIVCAAIAVLSGGIGHRLTLTRGLHRVVGTAAGILLYLAVVTLAPHGLWLAAILGSLQFAVEILVVRNYALALLFITPLVLVISTSAAGSESDPVGLASERLVDTMMGVALAAVATLVWRDRQPRLPPMSA